MRGSPKNQSAIAGHSAVKERWASVSAPTPIVDVEIDDHRPVNFSA